MQSWTSRRWGRGVSTDYIISKQAYKLIDCLLFSMLYDFDNYGKLLGRYENEFCSNFHTVLCSLYNWTSWREIFVCGRGNFIHLFSKEETEGMGKMLLSHRPLNTRCIMILNEGHIAKVKATWYSIEVLLAHRLLMNRECIMIWIQYYLA